MIGSGNRATAYAGYFNEDITYVYDPDIKKPPLLIERYNLINAVMVNDYKNTDYFDAIIVASPDHTHLEVMEWAVTKKKPILLEKPVEVSLDALKKLYEIASDYKYGIVLGFGLRYTFMYRKIIELIEEGVIGPLVSIEASETLGELHAAKFFRRWHRESRLSGGMLNTKCSHDMDIINIVAGAFPKRISSFGNNMLFKRKRGLPICSKDCPEFGKCIYVDESAYVFSSVDARICPFNIESDIVDHQSVNILFENNITAVFTLTMHSSKGNRTIRIHGEKGLIKGEFETQEVLLECKGKPNGIYKPKDTGGSHGGGDIGLCEFFRKCYENEYFPNQLEAGILASATALAADISRIDGSIVDFTEILNYIQGKK